MVFRQYANLLRRRWWIILLAALVAMAGAYLFSKRQTPIYHAQATLLLNLASQPAAPTFSDVSASQALTKTYAQILTADPTLEEAARRLGPTTKAADISRVTGSDVPQTELLQVGFNDPDPVWAAKVVNVVSQVFAERIKTAQLGEQSGAAASTVPPNTSLNTIFIAKPATVPKHPVTPNIPLNVAAATLVAIFLVTGLVIVADRLDDTVKDSATLEPLGLTLIGSIPIARETDVHLNQVSANPTFAEAFRKLRTNLAFASHNNNNELRTISVNSSKPGEGKTTVVCNLAITLANTGRTVIVIDCDLRRPSVHRFFNISNRMGLTNAFLSNSKDYASLLQNSGIMGLQLLTSGPLPPNPGELLATETLGVIIAAFKEQVDYILIDTPPTLAVSDAATISADVDGILVVAKYGESKTGALQATLDTLTHSRAKLLGIVINRVQRRNRDQYDYYYAEYGAPSESSATSIESRSVRRGQSQSVE